MLCENYMKLKQKMVECVPPWGRLGWSQEGMARPRPGQDHRGGLQDTRENSPGRPEIVDVVW